MKFWEVTVNTTSIVAYRNPAEQWLWESGALYCFIAFLVIAFLAVVFLDFLDKRRSKS